MRETCRRGGREVVLLLLEFYLWNYVRLFLRGYLQPDRNAPNNHV